MEVQRGRVGWEVVVGRPTPGSPAVNACVEQKMKERTPAQCLLEVLCFTYFSDPCVLIQESETVVG